MAETIRFYLGFGSNLGNREGFLKEAWRLLAVHPDLDMRRLSRMVETDPVGAIGRPAPGGRYLNAVGEGETRLGPQELLRWCQRVESCLGRVRRGPDSPRTIDIDLLFYGTTVLHRPFPAWATPLTVPHSRVLERGFVLEPLAELAPDLVHPVTQKTVAQHWLEWAAAQGRPEARE